MSAKNPSQRHQLCCHKSFHRCSCHECAADHRSACSEMTTPLLSLDARAALLSVYEVVSYKDSSLVPVRSPLQA
eukprot:5709967-Pleurochrysis_carterae.AAC.2